MGAPNCKISCCELLDFALQITNQRRFGVKCSETFYCDFSEYYLSACRDDSYNALIEATSETPVTTSFTLAFTGYVCEQVDFDTPIETYWQGSVPVCVLDGVPEENTGYQVFTILTEYYSISNLPTGRIKDNLPEDPDYIAPTLNLVACPTGAPVFYWLPTGPTCLVDNNGMNTGQLAYTTLTQYDEDDLPTGVTKPNTLGDPDYVFPVYNGVTCPVSARYWVAITPYCEEVEGVVPVEYTGYTAYTTLVEYYTVNNQPTGVTKPNTVGDPDYVAPILDPEGCFLTYHLCDENDLHFESSDVTQVSLLSVGNLVSTGDTIGDYFIEWHLGAVDGPITLTSGSGNDYYQATHPFVNEPVQGGVLYPVIVYIEFNGVMYRSNQVDGTRYSPDLLDCLAPLTVVSMNCSNGGAFGNYTHHLAYNNSIDPSNNASRMIKFDLNSDGSTQFFAWKFAGYTVADRIKVSYVSGLVTTLIDDWVVGTNSNTMNYTSSPKRYGNSNLLFVTDLRAITYASGDYILVEIIPRYFETTNVNTNWDLYLKCLSTFDCDIFPNDFQVINPASISMEYDALNCKYRVAFQTSVSWDSTTEDMFKYLSASMYGTSDTFTGAQQMYLDLRKSTLCVGNFYYTGSTCVNLIGTSNVSKVGNILTISLTSVTDYNAYKATYDAVVALAQYTGYTTDDTLLAHYRFFVLSLRTGTVCGDSGVLASYYIHLSSTVVFDDVAKTITITLVNTPNNLPTVSCDSSKTTVQTYITSAQNLISTANFSYTAGVRATSPFGFLFFSTTVFDETQKNFYWAHSIVSPIINDICDMAETPWCPITNAGYIDYMAYRFALRVEITDNLDPINNWRLLNRLDAEGCLITDSLLYTVIYEIVDGVVITP